MAKGAAKESQLGALHAKVAAVFMKVLATYEARLDAVEAVDKSDIEDEVLAQLLDDGAMPNPVMLSAITKFLKDNSVEFDNEHIEEMSNTQRRLEERRKLRGNVVSLTTLSASG
jgi:hypothetical protein